MFRLFSERLAWAIAFTVVIGFLLPWVKSKPQHQRNPLPENTVRELVQEAERPWVETFFMIRPQELAGALEAPLTGTSGLKILWLVRSQEARQRAEGKKLVAFLGSIAPSQASVLIYAVPASVLIGACFFTVAPQRPRWLFLVPLLFCGVLYSLMRARLSDTYFERLVLDQVAGLGLWVSLYGLLLMMGLLGIRLLFNLKSK
jgi:hypothetical protein